MNKAFKTLTFIVVVALAFIVTGCGKDPAASFKNPKEIIISKGGHKVSFKYDDDKKYEENKVNNSEVILTNSTKKFRIDFMYGTNTVKQQKQSLKYAKKNTSLKVLEDIEFNGYKGYVAVNKEYATADVYLYLDEKNDVVVDIRISTTSTSAVEKELKSKDPEDVLYNKEDVQNILKTVTYKK